MTSLIRRRLGATPVVPTPVVPTPTDLRPTLTLLGRLLSSTTPAWAVGLSGLVRQWTKDGADVPGATGLTYTVPDADAGAYALRLATSDGSIVVTSAGLAVAVVVSNLAQTATFGALTPANSGGWRPQLADGSVESLASYGGLVSGSLGSYVPSIVSGKLVFTGGGAGAPAGAVLSCTGASGRAYVVTVAQVANRIDMASDADLTAAPNVSTHYGRLIIYRQNARIGERVHGTTPWLSSTTQSVHDAALLQPITVRGEGAYRPGEWHLGLWSCYFPSGITVEDMVFDPTAKKHAFVTLSNSSVRNRNITFQRNRWECRYDVDNAAGGSLDWSGGFNSTGLQKASFITSNNTNGYTYGITLKDNIIIGGHTQVDLWHGGGALWFEGNSLSEAYFDYRKTTMPNSFLGKERKRIEGGNLYKKPVRFSVNETSLTEPHLDNDQVTGGGGDSLVTSYEADIHYHLGEAGLQTRFHLDRLATSTGGHRWDDAGSMFICSSTNALSSDWPDYAYLNRVVVFPHNVATLPVPANNNQLAFGTGKTGDGGTVGDHLILDCSFNGIRYQQPSGRTLVANITAAATYTGLVSSAGWVDGDWAAALDRWSDWPTLPSDPTYAEIFPYFKPMAGGPLVGKSPWSEITPPAPGALQSTYQISDVLRPQPTLANLTVTGAAAASFTVDVNVRDASVFWAVFAAEVTDPTQIREAVRNVSGTRTAALAYNVSHRGGAAGTLTGGGGAGLPAGTHWLCVACYNGPKKVTTATVQFTV